VGRGGGVKTNGTVIPVRTFENLGIPCKVVLFSGNSGKWCSIGHSKFPEIQTGTFMEWKAPQLMIFCLCLNGNIPPYNLF